MTKRSWGYLILVLIIVVAAAAWWAYRNSSTSAALIRTTARGLETTLRDQPTCVNVNTSKEGWFIGDAKVKYERCRKCTAECQNDGTRSAGWYNSCDGSLIVYANCTVPIVPSVDRPYCRADGSGEDGWYLRQRLVLNASCKNCSVDCLNVGTPDEGWYDGCNGSLIFATTCGGAQ